MFGEGRPLAEGYWKMKLKAASGIMLTLLLTGISTLAFNVQPVESSDMLLKVGVFGDFHWAADRGGPESSSEEYANWTRGAVEELEEWGADICIQVGDYACDHDKNRNWLTEAEMVEWQTYWFEYIWPATSSGGTPLYNVMGNHDFGNANKTNILALWPRPENLNVAYYSFDFGAFHFVVLDNHDYDHGQAKPASVYWTDCFRIWEEQKNWLIQDLESTSKPTFLFIHVPISGKFEGPGFTDYNSLRNGPEIRAILESYPHVVAFFEAHYHNPASGTKEAYHWQDGRVHYFGTGFPCVDHAVGKLTLDPVNRKLTYHVDSDSYTKHWEFEWDTPAKLSISPSSIFGPPPTIGESFALDIRIEGIIDLTSWQIGLAWDASILNCTSWTTLFNTTVMGPEEDWLAIEGTINNTKGEVYPPYAYSLEAGKTSKSGSDTLVQVSFTVLDYGFTWINVTYIKMKTGVGKTEIPVDVTNGSFALFAVSPAAPVASFTYSPSAPQFNQTVTFNASASVAGWNGTADVPIASYEWDFGDGNTTTVTNPVTYRTYTTAGTYTVNLTVTCQDDSTLVSLNLTSDSTWQDVTIAAVPVHDVAVIAVKTYPTKVMPSETVTVNVTIENEGDFTETFNVTAYYDNTAIDTQTVTNLAPNGETTLTFQLQPFLPGYPDNPPAAWPYPTYTIKANITVLLGEAIPSDNELTNGTLTVKWPGDLNGDGHVELDDLDILANHWRFPWCYDPIADINMDGEVELDDLDILANNWRIGPLD